MSDAQRIRDEAAQAISAGRGTVGLGRTVICDACDTDLTDDPRGGGYLFGSYGYGPCCAEGRLEAIRGYGEEHLIRARCPDGLSFADWMRAIRAATPGGGEIRVSPLRFGPPS